MGTAGQYYKKCIQGVLQFKSTSRECRNQKYCQGVSQFKYLRKCHNQKYYQGTPQSKVLSSSYGRLYLCDNFFEQNMADTGLKHHTIG